MNRLIYVGGLYGGTTAVLKAAGFLFTLWVAHTLTVEEYAVWGLVYALQSGLTTFGLVGIIESVVGLLRVQKTPEDRAGLFAGAHGVFALTMGISMTGAAIVGLLGVERKPMELPALLGMLASGALLGHAALQAEFVRLEERPLRSLSFSFVVPMAGLVGSVAFFAINRSVQSYFVGAAAGLAIALVVLYAARVHLLGVRLRGDAASKIRGRLAPFVAVAGFGWLNGYGGNFMVHSLFPPQEVARYTFALTIASILHLVANALNQAWSPRFYAITRTQPLEEVERKNSRFYLLQSVVLGATGAACLAILPPLLKAVGGNLGFYQTMGREFFFVAAGYLCLGPWWHCQSYFLAYDQGVRMMKVMLATSLIGTALWLILMWRLGPPGVYVGFLTQMVIRTAGGVFMARKQWRLRIAWGGLLLGLLILGCGMMVSQDGRSVLMFR